VPRGELLKPFASHGTGRFQPSDLRSIGANVVFEEGVLVFHPEKVSIGDNVYVGHGTILKGYHQNEMVIGSNTWIGQRCFFHSAGGIYIGDSVGIGPGVNILTSSHRDDETDVPVIHQELTFACVRVGAGSDIGVGAILLPGVVIGEGAVVGAGSVVTRDVSRFCVVAGNPARVLRSRASKG
jgi:acetyltransferase-like isoleucine patch superfamily enzyme